MMTDRVILRSIQLAMVCVLAGTALVVVHALRQVPRKPVTYQVGETFDVLPAALERHTIVLFVHSSCGACVRAKPVFMKVVNAALASHCRVAIASIGIEREYARDIGADAADAVQLKAVPGKLPFTPTLLVMDVNRRVEYVYVGVPQQEQLDAVTGVLQR